jgi:quercetin dioxygenase-like cupin family protein
MKNPNPGGFYRTCVLSEKDKAKELGGLFGIFVPGSQLPCHYHKKRESILICLSGDSIMMFDGKEFPIKAGDILHIPIGKKHGLIDRSNKDFRYIEFYTYPPVEADFIETEIDLEVQQKDHKMKIFNIGNYISLDNPTSDKYYRSEILNNNDGINDIGGIWAILSPGGLVPYHTHVARESIFIAIDGEAIQIVEGEEFPIIEGDIMYIPSDEKHGLVNRKEKPFRYIEFWTHPPASADFWVIK